MTTATVPVGSIGDTGLPPAAWGRGGGGSGWTELVRMPSDVEAHLLAGALASNGIDSSLVPDRSAPGAWLHMGARNPVVVMVRTGYLSEARLVLAEVAYAAPARAPVREPGGWRAAMVWWSLALMLGTALTGVALARTAAVLGRCELPLLCDVSGGPRD